MATSSKWTAGEDSILAEAVLVGTRPHLVYFGTVLSVRIPAGSRICWNTIAERLPGRSNKSCRKRWIHSLDPSLRKGLFVVGSTVFIIVLTPEQAGGQPLKMHFLLRLYEDMVVTGTKSRSCCQVEPTTNAPRGGGRNWTHQSVRFHFPRGHSHY